jgi:hypothetical protein
VSRKVVWSRGGHAISSTERPYSLLRVASQRDRVPVFRQARGSEGGEPLLKRRGQTVCPSRFVAKSEKCRSIGLIGIELSLARQRKEEPTCK